MNEQVHFLTSLDAQKNIPQAIKTWIKMSHAYLIESQKSHRMTPAGYDVAMRLLSLIAQSYQNRRQRLLVRDLKGIMACLQSFPDKV